MISCVHHFEIFTKSSSKKLLSYFNKGLKFDLINFKQTKSQLALKDSSVSSSSNRHVYDQYLLNCNAINFFITTINDQQKSSPSELFSSLIKHNVNKSNFNSDCQLFQTSLSVIEQTDPDLFGKIIDKQDSAFNVAFKVCDLDQILANCRRHNVRILKPRHSLIDYTFNRNSGRGKLIDCALIKSCVDGVVHTLIEESSSNSGCMEEEESLSSTRILKKQKLINGNNDDPKPTHFDHLTFATHRNTSNKVIEWYKRIFNMKRIRIEHEQEDGLMVKTGKSGMNLKVINYWFCAETGVFIENNQQNQSQNKDFKLVIAEPLDDDEKRNQIAIFLDENGGPGVQHIGLHSANISKLVELTRTSLPANESIAYFETPESYYQAPEKIIEIEDCGLSVEHLKENHVLLDAEFNESLSLSASTSASTSNEQLSAIKLKSYLLQVFTKPLFEKNTLFLEFIQRVGQANGFGAGNIIALWKAVESEMNKEKIKQQQQELKKQQKQIKSQVF